jgi:glutathione S-transferase
VRSHSLVLGATVSAVFINVLHVLKVMECRHKFGIKPPAVVAGPEHIKKHPDAALFDCGELCHQSLVFPKLTLDEAFRAHANYLENLPPFLVSIAILGLRYPVASAVATAIWIAGRVAYLFGYVNKGKQGAKARVP